MQICKENRYANTPSQPEAWDPHTGQFSVPEYANVVEDGQPVTKVKLTLGRVHSIFHAYPVDAPEHN